MPDMRRLVGIDAGMLDQHFARGNLRHRSPVRRQLRRHFGAVHANVNVAAARHFEFFKAGNRADPGHDLLRNLARSLAQLARQFEGEGQRVLAKFDFRRLLDHDRRDLQVVSAAQKLAQMLDQTAFQISIQEVLERIEGTVILTNSRAVASLTVTRLAPMMKIRLESIVVGRRPFAQTRWYSICSLPDWR